MTPTPDTVTVRQHHSFVQLPPPGYTPRRLDPRAGFFGIVVYDYASPFAAPLEKRFIARHRLQKKDPAAAVSDVVQPIVYYVDNAADVLTDSGGVDTVISSVSWNLGAEFENITLTGTTLGSAQSYVQYSLPGCFIHI